MGACLGKKKNKKVEEPPQEPVQIQEPETEPEPQGKECCNEEACECGEAAAEEG